jgi:hypothetical protein
MWCEILIFMVALVIFIEILKGRYDEIYKKGKK